jgi:hypothetical protein
VGGTCSGDEKCMKIFILETLKGITGCRCNNNIQRDLAEIGFGNVKYIHKVPSCWISA